MYDEDHWGGDENEDLRVIKIMMTADEQRRGISLMMGKKVVFATETLAAGINMPARTTVISALARRRGRS